MTGSIIDTTNLTIYFSASIRGGREMAHVYPHITDSLIKAGHNVISQIFASQDLDATEGTGEDEVFIYERDMDWIRHSSVMVAEVTQPSIGVGYEIAKAESAGKPVYCLYNTSAEGSLSAMVSGNKNLHLIRYTDIYAAVSVLKEIIHA